MRLLKRVIDSYREPEPYYGCPTVTTSTVVEETGRGKRDRAVVGFKGCVYTKMHGLEPRIAFSSPIYGETPKKALEEASKHATEAVAERVVELYCGGCPYKGLTNEQSVEVHVKNTKDKLRARVATLAMQKLEEEEMDIEKALQLINEIDETS